MPILFKIILPESREHSSEIETSPYVGLTDDKLTFCIDNMVDKDEIVIRRKHIRVCFNYPLKRDYIFTLESSGDAFTRGGLAESIGLKYQEIYNEEKRTSVLNVETIGERISRERSDDWRCNILNRAPTNGVYGIWGHKLEDLDLFSVEWNEEKEVYELCIES